jgi:hypothetical protein
MSPSLLGRALYPGPTDHEARARQVRRSRVWVLVAILALVLLAGTGPSDVAGASGQEFAEWYSQSENREYYEWHQWMQSDPRNRSWFAIDVHFGDNEALLASARKVASCESGYWPDALNRSSGAAGLFQVMPSWASRYEQVTGTPYYDGRFDPDANAMFSRWLVDSTGGWSHWSCRS